MWQCYAVVTQRPTLANFPEYVLWDYTDTYEERWVGLGAKKGVRFCTGEEARPHYVCVVETDNQTREPHLQQPRCMDAAGITFEDGVNPVIQASLTLFHFDFYIRTSATRGKKISFVTDVWLDAKRRS